MRARHIATAAIAVAIAAGAYLGGRYTGTRAVARPSANGSRSAKPSAADITTPTKPTRSAALRATTGQTTTTIPSTGPPATTTTQPPGTVSGQVEYLCSDGSGAGGNGSAAIAAVRDGQGNWLCPSAFFDNLWPSAVGGMIYCTTDQSGNAYDSPPFYKATVGYFTTSAPPGTYYGVYCTEPGEDSLWPAA